MKEPRRESPPMSIKCAGENPGPSGNLAEMILKRLGFAIVSRVGDKFDVIKKIQNGSMSLPTILRDRYAECNYFFLPVNIIKLL
jgi:hypothetical protein